MSNVWKWVLGVLGVVIVVGLVAGAVFLWRARAFDGGVRAYAPGTFEKQVAPGQPGDPQPYGDFRRYHMQGYGGGAPMMGQQYAYGPGGFSPMGGGLMFGGGLFHMLIPLGLVALIAYVFYQMGKRVGMAAAITSNAVDASNGESAQRRRTSRS
jgi:hypothetical protein